MVAASQKLLRLVGGRQPGVPGGFEPPLPVRRKPGAGEGCATDRDATDPVPIHWFPNPSGIAHLRGRR